MTNTGVIISEHHIFSKGGTSLLYDVNNMNLYEISGECRDIIEAIDSGKPVENGCGEDYDMVLDALKAAGMLISEAENSPDEAESEVTSVIKAESKENIHFTHIILELANDCNLNCKYCYGDGGSYGRKREMMSLETAKKAVDFLVNNSGEGRNLGIVFFGGEPLMNFKVMKAVAHYCRAISAGTDKKFSYSMTTNGTILNDEIYEFIKENNISLTLSIDGPKNIQDCYRCYVSGKGSYDVLLPNIQKLVELKKGNLLARATVCHPNLNLNDILNELWKLKFKSIALSLVDAKETSDLYIKDEDFPVLLDEVWKLSDAYIESAKAGKHHPYFLLDAIIQDIYEKYEKRIACGAGRGAIAIGTDGKFYPCQRFMEWKIMLSEVWTRA